MNYGSPSTAHAPTHGGYPGTIEDQQESKGPSANDARQAIQSAFGSGVESSYQAVVAVLPACDFCGWVASYDAKTQKGPWANMCEDHFQANGVGLGLGRGQRLVVR